MSLFELAVNGCCHCADVAKWPLIGYVMFRAGVKLYPKLAKFLRFDD